MTTRSSLPLPLTQVVLSGLNHVLQQQPGLRRTLQAHAGRELRIVVATPRRGPVLGADARIGTDGLLTVVQAAEPAVTMTLSPDVDAVFSALRNGPAGLGEGMRIDGDVMLAAAIGQVARAFRWDVEEDLSRIVGDVAAHRLGRAWRSLRARAGIFGDRSRETLGRTMTSGVGPLLGRDDLASFGQALRELEARVERLERREPGSSPAPRTQR